MVSKVEEYYNKTQLLYNIFYSSGTGGLHYGFWGYDTKNAAGSILNTNKFIAECLDVQKNDKILDAGCGVCGTCIYLVKKFNVKVTGITVSDAQVRIAKKLIGRVNLDGKIDCHKMDFNKTKFADSSFTKIFALESACHAPHKIDFLREAYRLLQRGGKLVVSDGFLVRKPACDHEQKIYEEWLHGWALPNIANVDNFHNDLLKAGFKNVKFIDKFNEVRKTRDRIYRIGFFGYPFTWFFSRLGVIGKEIHYHTIACIRQKTIFSDTNKLATYGVFVAKK